ncbi:hypothetical protein SAMN05192529_11857 [Arachidicoccus rhizosphaerae]|uniref:Uncharacterized protein n=1 Tax=Arachidicoccus rhizosphaerae TaxID=551991 RepID=A0A1H4B5T5_9BACT|nr:hypothetical protein [Arachidicoccus rhizosphaerae]SEA43318.1 hypothetical protein SAMN05192529_11857 [Arachidicoccus rhizosphaerae]
MRKQKRAADLGDLSKGYRNKSGALLLMLVLLSLSISSRLFGQPKHINAPVIRHELDRIYREDQLNRYKLVAMDQNWNDSLQVAYDSLWALQKSLDRQHMLTIDQLQTTYGWDDLMRLPDTAKQVIFLVIQHSDSLHMIKYLPLINRSAQKGDLPKEDYALLQDRVSLMQGGKQYFGSQIYWDSKQNQYLPLPVLGGREAAEKRRRVLGIETLVHYLDRCNKAPN